MIVLLFVDIDIEYLDTFWKKITLFVVTLGELYLLLNLILYWLRSKYLKIIKTSKFGWAIIIFMILLGAQYLSIFNILSAWFTISIFIIGFIVTPFLLTKNKQ